MDTTLLSRPGTARRDSVLALFGVEPGEVERVLLMLLLSLVSVGGIVITGQIVGRSLFLSALPPSAIPLRFILPPIVLVLTTAAYTRRLGRGEQSRVIVNTLLALAAAVLVCRLLAGTPLRDARSFLLGLFSLLDIAGNLAMILFWTIAASIFDPREARRLFGLISSGSAISNIAFGLFLGELAKRVSPENLMWLVLLSLLAAAAIVRHLGRRYATATAPPLQEPLRGTSRPARAAVSRAGALAALRESLTSPLVGTLAAIVIVISLVANVTDYQLDLALKQTYGGDGQGMIGFLARLRLVAGVGAFAVQFFLAGRFLGRFGVLPALVMLPGTVGLGTAGILATGGALWAVSLPRAADIALKYSVNDSAFNLLYLPLAPAARSRAKALIDGMLKPPVVALLGLTFLFVDRFARLSVVQWSIPVLALVAVWLFLLVRAERRYVSALAQSIALRRFDPALEGLAFADETSQRVLAEALRDASPAKVIHALTLVRGTPDRDWGQELLPLFSHPVPEVRAASLDVLTERPIPRLLPAVRERMDDEDASVREAAFRCYGRALGSRAVAELTARLSDPSPSARGAAVAALVQHGGLGGFLHAGGPLHAMLGSEDPEERREGARVLGLLGVPSFYHPLLELVQDPDRSVRLAAIQAAERTAAPELLPALSQALLEPQLRRQTIAAIVACAQGDLSVLGTELQDASRPRELRCQVARSLLRFGPRATQFLSQALEEKDDVVRGAVLEALSSLREAAGRLDVDPARLARRLDAELRVATERWLCLHELREAGVAAPLLLETLERAAAADRGRIIDLLALVYPDLNRSSLRDALLRTGGRRRAEAIELIDSVAVAVRGLVVPYVGGTDAQRLEAAERRLGLRRLGAAARLEQLATESDPWLRACALDAIGRSRLADQLAGLVTSAAAREPRVAASARAALVHLTGSASAPAPPGGAARLQEGTKMPLVPLEQILFLKQVPLFRDIPGEEVAGLLPIVEEVEFPAGATIIRQGDVGDGLYIIVEGRVAIDVDGQRAGEMGSRHVIGELALLSGEPRSATCTALSEVMTLGIRREPFWQLMRDHPEVSLGVIRILLDYLRQRQPAASPEPTVAA